MSKIAAENVGETLDLSHFTNLYVSPLFTASFVFRRHINTHLLLYTLRPLTPETGPTVTHACTKLCSRLLMARALCDAHVNSTWSCS